MCDRGRNNTLSQNFKMRGAGVLRSAPYSRKIALGVRIIRLSAFLKSNAPNGQAAILDSPSSTSTISRLSMAQSLSFGADLPKRAALSAADGFALCTSAMCRLRSTLPAIIADQSTADVRNATFPDIHVIPPRESVASLVGSDSNFAGGARVAMLAFLHGVGMLPILFAIWTVGMAVWDLLAFAKLMKKKCTPNRLSDHETALPMRPVSTTIVRICHAPLL